MPKSPPPTPPPTAVDPGPDGLLHLDRGHVEYLQALYGEADPAPEGEKGEARERPKRDR